jgi:DNA (cytosine-5)-methyltransferase 3A
MAVEIKRIKKTTPDHPKYNVLSLFDGMSCGQLALKQINVDVVNYFASEVDTHAMHVAKSNFPNMTHIGDVRDVDMTNRDSDEHPWILIGGSPCQNFSFAGSSKGMATKENIEVTTLEQYLDLKSQGFEFHGQSYLFWEYVRILKELKPKYFLLENVKMAKKWKDLISGVMGVEPILINSSLVSAQNRERLFWTNIPGVTQPQDRGIVLGDILESIPGREVKNTDRNLRHERKLNQKSLCTTATMYKGAGNNGMTLIRRPGVDYLSTLTPLEVERLQCVPDNYTDHVSNTQRYKMLGNGWTIDVIAHILKGIQ